MTITGGIGALGDGIGIRGPVDWRMALVTANAAEAFRLPVVAVIVAVPSFMPVAIPDEETVAIAVLLDCQVRPEFSALDVPSE